MRKIQKMGLIALILITIWFDVKLLLLSSDYIDETTSLINLQLNITKVYISDFNTVNISLKLHNPTSRKISIISIAGSLNFNRTLIGSCHLDFSFKPLIIEGGTEHVQELFVYVKKIQEYLDKNVRIEVYIIVKTDYHGEIRKSTVYIGKLS